MKFNYNYIKTFFGVLVGTTTLAGTTLLANEGYKKSTTPSKFELAATKLKFGGINSSNLKVTKEQQQEALLKAFYYAGYFNLENLWQDINHLGFKNPKKVFISIAKQLINSGANQSDPEKFDAKKLRKNLFDSDEITVSDVKDLLLYIGQHAFNRVKNQERDSLTQQNWMDKYKEQYIEEARKIGLVERIWPEHKEYDVAWIAGASFPGILSRIVDFSYMINSKTVEIKGETEILAGQRLLWAEIDGIPPKLLKVLEDTINSNSNIDTANIPTETNKSDSIEQGKNYMKYLAETNNIELDNDKPFIIYQNNDVKPKGFFNNRTYPNYINPKEGILTETIMAHDLLERYLGNHSIKISHTDANGKERPNTATTAKTVAKELVAKIQKGEFDKGNEQEVFVYFQSNQPYTQRQTIVTQRAVDEILKEHSLNANIKVDGVGFVNKLLDIARTHSELGALINEKYIESLDKDPSRRNIKDLQFRTRDKTLTDTTIPTIEEDSPFDLTGYFKNFFDDYLE